MGVKAPVVPGGRAAIRDAPACAIGGYEIAAAARRSKRRHSSQRE